MDGCKDACGGLATWMDRLVNRRRMEGRKEDGWVSLRLSVYLDGVLYWWMYWMGRACICTVSSRSLLFVCPCRCHSQATTCFYQSGMHLYNSSTSGLVAFVTVVWMSTSSVSQ